MSGREAEALHAEEDDQAEDSGDEDPIQVITHFQDKNLIRLI